RRPAVRGRRLRAPAAGQLRDRLQRDHAQGLVHAAGRLRRGTARLRGLGPVAALQRRGRAGAAVPRAADALPLAPRLHEQQSGAYVSGTAQGARARPGVAARPAGALAAGTAGAGERLAVLRLARRRDATLAGVRLVSALGVVPAVEP